MMRGYSYLKKKNQLFIISSLKEALSEHNLRINNNFLSPYILGTSKLKGELAIRQYLLIRLGNLGLNKELLFSLGNKANKVVYPLPNEWQKIISNRGFKVSRIKSNFLWILYIFAAWIYGVLVILRIFFNGILGSINKDTSIKNYVYFDNIKLGNLPHNSYHHKSYDIVSWYLNWKGKAKDFKNVHHSVFKYQNKVVEGFGLIFQPHTLPPLSKYYEVINFLFWGIFSSFYALFDIFRGRWWHAFLLNQAALAKIARLIDKNKLAKEYLFNNSSFIYRPLWTYEAEKAGSIITFYFYSTNCDSFKNHVGDQPIPFGWKAMSWSRYLVWNKNQVVFLNKSIKHNYDAIIVGPIPFQDDYSALPEIKKNSLAIFDVTPLRKSSYIQLGLGVEYYTYATINQFFKDIREVFEGQDINLVWKEKRERDDVHPAYLYIKKKLFKQNNLVQIHSDISAIHVIEKCSFVISIPFTSTALIAKKMGKNSIYYDPTGMIDKNNRAAHNIQVLSSVQELRDWSDNLRLL